MFFRFGAAQKTVLLIDDDHSLRRQMLVRLERVDKVQVLQAEDGSGGLQRAQQDLPDLVVLDWMLPDIPGTMVLERLKRSEKTRNIPVLMVTGRNKLGDIDDAFALGADAYLTKPFSLQKLGEKVSKMLGD